MGHVNKNLAKALMQHGMQHFFLGGLVDSIGGAIGGAASGLASGIGGAASGIGRFASGIPGTAFGLASKIPGVIGDIAGGVASFPGHLIGGGLQGLTGDIQAQPNQFQANPASITNRDYGVPLDASQNNMLAGYDRALQDRQNQMALEQILSGQYTGGTGPSVAQNMLAKQTGENLAAQGSLLAGQRGGGANAGLLAREGALQGGRLQQQSTADAAILRANEQIALRQALQNQQAMISSQNLAQQGIVGKNFAETTAAQNAQNKNTIENTNNAQKLNADVAKQNAQMTNDLRMGVIRGIGDVASSAGIPKAHGGEVPDHLHKVGKIFHGESYMSGGRIPGQMGQAQVDSTSNDVIPILASPGEVVLPKSVTQAKDAPAKAALFMKHLMEKKEKKDYGRIAKARRKSK